MDKCTVCNIRLNYGIIYLDMLVHAYKLVRWGQSDQKHEVSLNYILCLSPACAI